MSRAALISLMLAFCAACTEEALDPAPSDEAPPTSEVPTTDPPDVPTAKPPKRTVIERNPFGNVAASDNLLWDGDFEWASPFASQYGWYQLPSTPTIEEPVMGPMCRSGVKCARVKKNDDILGIAVGARDEALYASVHVKFEPDEEGIVSPCDEAAAVILDAGFDPPKDPDVELTLLTPVPDVTGYCTFAGLVEPRKNKPYFLLSNHGDGPMLVDDAVLLRATSASVPSGAIPPALPVRTSRKARVESSREAARAFPRGGEGRPNPVVDALEAQRVERARAQKLPAQVVVKP